MRFFRRYRRSGLQVASLVVVVSCARAADAAKVACVGDSITYGYGLNDRSKESYPAVLSGLLGSAHTVQNFGVSGATLLKNGDKPYWKETTFSASDSFDPDVVIVMLGTNDAKPQNWSHKSEFSTDYLAFIDHYRALGASVYVMTPPPVYDPGAYDIPPNVVASEVVPLVGQIAAQANAPLVDVFQALSGKASCFPDTVHPNAQGEQLIAEAVAAALKVNGFGLPTDAGVAVGAGGGGAGGGAGGGVAVAAGGHLAAGRGGSASGQGGATGFGGSTDIGEDGDDGSMGSRGGSGRASGRGGAGGLVERTGAGDGTADTGSAGGGPDAREGGGGAETIADSDAPSGWAGGGKQAGGGHGSGGASSAGQAGGEGPAVAPESAGRCGVGAPVSKAGQGCGCRLGVRGCARWSECLAGLVVIPVLVRRRARRRPERRGDGVS